MAVVLFLLLGIGAGVMAIFLVRKRWRFTDTPTSDAAHVFPGLSEVHGVVEAIGAPARAATDGAECVYWSYKVERQVKDKNSTRWVTEEHGVTAQPFHVRDESGVVRVVLDEDCTVAKLDGHDVEHLSLAFLRPYARVLKDTYEPGAVAQMFGKVFGSNDANEPISDFGGVWRANEHRLCVGDTVFVSAHARLTPGGDQVEFARTDAQGKRCLFEVTQGDEKAAVGAHAGAFGIVLMSVLSLVFGGLASKEAFGDGGIVVLPLVFLGAVAAVYLVGIWNRVRRTRERGLFAWSLIDVACEQRSNLVPQLQAVVGAALAHEKGVLEAVAAARQLGRKPSADRVGTVRAADTAATHLVARVEAYPDLKTQANVAQLMQHVALLTDRVAFGRRFYNDSVLRLQNRLGQFPVSWIARAARVTALPYIDDLDPPAAPPALGL